MADALRKTKVWDLPTRLFHWSLACLVLAAYITAEMGVIEWHFRCGYAILTLLLFRLVWGVVGSDTSRFVNFVRSPVSALAHLAHFTRREPDTEVGHNAAGGLMVLALLALLLVQVGTGLFSNDGVFSEGPLAKYVSAGLSDQISEWHEVNFNLILAAIILHVLAVLAYAVVKRHDLVRPMVLGWKKLPAGMRNAWSWRSSR
ncbi:MAG: hypothetical protein B7Z15_05910 [Rhizobiales bacterium 32-66-8]|nr:MAG: hypothetical protein B7Z15_05910 [Rhizobiales bacterium 32-66-8]